VVTNADKTGRPGRIAPACLFAAFLAGTAAAQPPRAPAPAAQVPAAQAPVSAVPDSLVVHKLVWSAMAALDHANQTGNYSVLRDLGAPSFQAGNSAATLGAVFASFRSQNIDLGYCLVTTPVLQFPAALVQGGLLRIRGVFPLRPRPVGFDLLFQNIAGQWRVFAIAVVPLVAGTQQAAPIKR
jgi:hypothetical protein